MRPERTAGRGTLPYPAPAQTHITACLLGGGVGMIEVFTALAETGGPRQP